MSRIKEPYSIVRPAKKGGAYRYRLGSDPKRRLRSTGKMTKREAILFCDGLLKANAKADMTLREYSKDFYVSGKCPYAAIRRRTNRPIDDRTLSDERSRLENYILPAFGDIKLKDLSVAHWDQWLEDIETGKVLTKGRNPHHVADGTVNRIRRTLIQLLDVGKRHGVLPTNIMRDAEPMSQKTYKARDALMQEDIAKLFPEDQVQLLKVWGSVEKVALFSLLLTSGLRSGEVQALQWGKVNFADKGIIIDQSVKYGGTVGSTKTDTPRVFVLPQQTLNHLAAWKEIAIKKGDNEFVFYNRKGSDHVRGDSILAYFKRVLKRNGFAPNKNLVIHSFRHTFTTVLAEKLPIESVMAFTGHKTASMIARYSHPSNATTLKNMKAKFDSQIASIWDEKLGGLKEPGKATSDKITTE
jgi:integrase